MGQATALYIDDFDTSRIGFWARRADGRQGVVTVRDRTTQLPKRAGEIALAREGDHAPRRIIVVGTIKGTSVSQVLSRREELKGRLSRGTVEVRFVDDPDRVYYARLEEGDIRGTDPEFNTLYSDVSFTLYCPDPLIYQRYSTRIPFTSQKAAMPLGRAPSLPIIRIAGAVTNPVLTLRDIRGAIVKTLGLTVTLGATEYVEINCETSAITRVTAGVAANAPALMTSGDFLMLDPHDGDPVTNLWPTLECSPTAACEALYTKADL